MKILLHDRLKNNLAVYAMLCCLLVLSRDLGISVIQACSDQFYSECNVCPTLSAM